MSKHIVKMYNKIDAEINKASSNKVTKNTGLIPKRDTPTEDSDVVHYIKQLRKMREDNNGTK
jgi:hypothetical protein